MVRRRGLRVVSRVGGALVLAALLAFLAPTARPPEARAQPAPVAGLPVRLLLPSIAVDADVEALDLNDDLTMPVPQVAWLAAWYSYSARAGAPGNVVLAGHRDWQRQRGVFYDLGDVQEGDEVWLQDAPGNWYLYTVVWSINVEADTAPVAAIAGRTDTPSVTLITCAGAFDRATGRYREHRIVRAHLAQTVPAVALSGRD